MTDLPALALGAAPLTSHPQPTKTNRQTRWHDASQAVSSVLSAASPHAATRCEDFRFVNRRRLGEGIGAVGAELPSRPPSRSAWARPDPGANGSRRQ